MSARLVSSAATKGPIAAFSQKLVLWPGNRKDTDDMERAAAEMIERNSLTLSAPFVLTDAQPILSGRPKGEELRLQVIAHLERAPDESVTPLDLGAVGFMDVSCADELLNKLLLRVRSGELGSRFVYICSANTSLCETIEAVLQLRELALLFKATEAPTVLGELKRPLRQTLEVILEQKSATSAEMSVALDKNVNIVCNRLNALHRMGLICRMRDLSVVGGGRQYYYVSLV
jgi:hypothetical protein